MESKSPRSFSSMSAPGLSDEARKAVNGAFDAMSTWRSEIAGSSEKNIENVIDKMAAAARALGWPEQIVEATRTHMQRGSKMQIEMMKKINCEVLRILVTRMEGLEECQLLNNYRPTGGNRESGVGSRRHINLIIDFLSSKQITNPNDPNSK